MWANYLGFYGNTVFRIFNIGTVAVSVDINYSNYLFNHEDSTWKYYASCTAIHNNTGELVEYSGSSNGEYES